MIIGIIGGGPRALWAAELLVDLHRRRHTPAHLTIHLFDPFPPGAGRVYRTDQPRCWRLNAPARIVMTSEGTLPEWMDLQGVPPENFPPRALVGEFLEWSWGRLVASTGEGVTLDHRAERVTSVEPAAGGRWRIGGRETSVVADRVLVAEGHAWEWEGALAAEDVGTSVVFPYGGGLESIGVGQRVQVRGAALTFIDVCLALSEGRGGRFLADESAASGLRYVPSGREPERIVAWSRSGRFMEVKPEPGGRLHGREIPGEEQLCAQIRVAAGVAEIREAVAAAAGELLRGVAGGAGGMTGAEARDAIETVLDGADGSGDAAADYLHSLHVVQGIAEPSAAWAVGAAWRRLYPAIVERVSYRHVPGFVELARRLERVGFGPPAVTSARVLALLEHGLVERTLRTEPLVGAAAGAAVDITVDAVIPPPGVRAGTVVGDLVERGIVALDERGLLVLNRDGSVPGHPSLAIVGRDAEGTVLGHDTVNRTMHPELSAWARATMDALEGSDCAPDSDPQPDPELDP